MKKNNINKVQRKHIYDRGTKKNAKVWFKCIIRALCGAVLGMVILCCQKSSFQLVYGSDGYSETGGFDMDVGEGTAQLPDDWDSTDSSNESQTDNSGNYTDYEDYAGSGNTAGNSGQESDWSIDNSNWQDSTQWGYEQADEGGYYESDGGISSGNTADSGDTGRENRNGGTENVDDGRSGRSAGPDGAAAAGTQERSLETAATQASGNQVSPITDNLSPTPTPGISNSPTPVPTRKLQKTKAPTPVRKVSDTPEISSDSRKQQKLALSYYQTEEKAVSSSEDEKLPEFTVKIKDSHIWLMIKNNAPEIPLQILSFRINGKECAWHWQGRKLEAEIPAEISKVKKAEILLYMSSGRLYHKIIPGIAIKGEQ